MVGKAAEAAAGRWLKSVGANVVGNQVRVTTAKGIRVIDFLVQKGNRYFALEIKGGNAPLKMKQYLKDQAMLVSGAFWKAGKLRMPHLPTTYLYF